MTMIDRIEKKFLDLKTINKKALITFVTAGDPDYSTSLNLIKNKWNGYLIEGDELKCDKLNSCIKHFFKNQKIYIENLFVDYENINEILQKKVNKLNFDFFSLDTDGMDYWILEKLNFQPKP